MKWQWVGEDKKPGSTINEHTIIDSNQDKPYFQNSKTKTQGHLQRPLQEDRHVHGSSARITRTT